MIADPDAIRVLGYVGDDTPRTRHYLARAIARPAYRRATEV